jgi:hypothetical protein
MCFRALEWLKRAILKKTSEKNNAGNKYLLTHEKFLSVKLNSETRSKFSEADDFDGYCLEIVKWSLAAHHSMEWWLHERRLRQQEKLRLQKERERLKGKQGERLAEINDFLSEKFGRENPFEYVDAVETVHGQIPSKWVAKSDMPEAEMLCKVLVHLISDIGEIFVRYVSGRKLNGISILTHRIPKVTPKILQQVVKRWSKDSYVKMQEVGDWNICAWINAQFFDCFKFKKEVIEIHAGNRDRRISEEDFLQLLIRVLDQRPDSEWKELASREESGEGFTYHSLTINVHNLECYWVRQQGMYDNLDISNSQKICDLLGFKLNLDVYHRAQFCYGANRRFGYVISFVYPTTGYNRY